MGNICIIFLIKVTDVALIMGYTVRMSYLCKKIEDAFKVQYDRKMYVTNTYKRYTFVCKRMYTPTYVSTYSYIYTCIC